MDITPIISSLKAAYDLAKGLSSFKTTEEVGKAVAPLLDVILSAMSKIENLEAEKLVLVQTVETLTKENTEFTNWSKTETCYKLHELAPGVFVYAYQGQEHPMHYLCANCFSKKQKSILNQLEPKLSGLHYKCPIRSSWFLKSQIQKIATTLTGGVNYLCGCGMSPSRIKKLNCLEKTYC